MSRSLIVHHPDYGSLEVPLPPAVEAKQEAADALLLLITETELPTTVYWVRVDGELRVSIDIADAAMSNAEYLGSTIIMRCDRVQTLH